MPRTKYQVFVSSTYRGLEEERRLVMQALLEMDCIPSGMELFPASSDEVWKLIESVIAEADYYVLIVGGRYRAAPTWFGRSPGRAKALRAPDGDRAEVGRRFRA